MDVDEFVVRNLTGQIGAFTQTITTMNERLSELPAGERKKSRKPARFVPSIRHQRGRAELDRLRVIIHRHDHGK